MATFSWLSLSLCLLVLSHGCSAARYTRQQGQQGQFGQQRGCQVENLNPLEPSRRIQHEAGVSEIWDQNSSQMQCAGVSTTRHVLEPKGLLLPSFNNAPMLVYVVQGEGIMGTMISGCPETFQSFQQFGQEMQGQRSFKDQHQKLHFFRQGDIVALPAGVPHWCYNDGNNQLVLVVVHDTSNNANQLDQNLRRFFLGGNPQQRQPGSTQRQQQQQETESNNIFQGFDAEILAEAFGVDIETVRKLQSENDQRGSIVRVEKGLQVIRSRREEEEEGRQYRPSNGLEETFCTMRIRENLADPERTDVYSVQGGRISTLNSMNLPILKYLQLSAERGVLYRNAMVAPYWNVNAHSIIYVIRGTGRVQIVGSSKRAVYDGQIREGQLLIVPQNFAIVKQAGEQGLEWISIKTNDLAKISPLAGKTSVIRAMPEQVLTSAYQLSSEEARRLKYNRDEVTILSPRHRSQERGSGSSAWSIVY